MIKANENTMQMNLQFFAEPGDPAASTEPAAFDTGNDDLNGLLGSIQLGQTEPAAQTDPAGTPPAAEPNPAPAEGTPPEGDVSQLPQNKQNYMFQQMRLQNQQLNQLLGKLAQANGIEYANPKELIDKLNDNAIEALSKRQNVPVELLREVESLRADSEAFKAMQYQNNAAAGFQSLVNTYGLDQKALETFAIELDQAGVNPFTSNVDIMNEYKVRHFDEIMQANIDKAVAAALARSTNADTHSTTPATTSTPAADPAGDGDKITTLEGLTKLLGSLDN